MRFWFSAPLLTFFLAAVAYGADAPQPQYVVHLELKQGSLKEPTTARVLAAPSVATTAGREVNFHSGGEVRLHEEFVDKIGSEVSLRIQAVGDGKVRVRGKFVLTQALAQSEDVTGTTGMRIYFDRVTTLGRLEKFVLSDSAEDAIWLEASVELAAASAR
jgi:hypothetical protein